MKYDKNLPVSTSPSVTKKRSTYSHGKSDDAKAERRTQGERRNAFWAGLTLDEKIEKLSTRRGESRKQVLQLTGRDISAKEALKGIRGEK